MPMIDVYAAADLFPVDADRQLAEELTLARFSVRWASRRPGPAHLDNTGAYIHRLPPSAVHTARSGSPRTVRVQILTPPGVLDHGSEASGREVTQIVAKTSGDPSQSARTWGC